MLANHMQFHVSPPHHSRRVVITGAGAFTPLGHTPQDMARAIREGRSPFRHAPALPGAACAPVPDFDAAAATGRWRHRRYLSRGGLLALAAALAAAGQAGYTCSDMAGMPGVATGGDAPHPQPFPEDTALVAASGPNMDVGADFPTACGRGRIQHDTPPGLEHPGLDALWMLRWLPNTAASAVAMRCGIRGEGLVLGTACAASLQAVGEAARRVRWGLAPAALAVGGDSRLSEGGLLGYARAGAIQRDLDPADAAAPHAACRPFDAARRGFVPGEGGAAFVLEPLDAALARGATPLAEVLGMGATLDGHALTAPEPDARRAEAAVGGALAEAGLSPGDVHWVAAHGTGTALNDAAEIRLLERMFADAGHAPAVTAVKSWTGHCASACGAVELAVLLACTAEGFLPPVRNLSAPESGRLDFVRRVRRTRPLPGNGNGSIGLLLNFGFGGQNAALVVRL
ncbi:beta-ketoacyl-[acyl-carrier-protein] synthase family protein [Nitratidesulfovibrio sp. HK-II]|uniref:beta-ketoacyl-[acyl-carrier-protein] synthase family protein n=1 Tax=Nitratidesulfovibrio sp. HK-II TaxID=2009266 RepID=UPI000EC0B85A|nr:beta-ketoacyl-[acyl-carrier-protein] synthase family protein [Nitratidesulfovibrio sp. HK-II]GBO95357.1 3-oxoacyl-[acyl-carrier-protein] synthase [Nitratidesulfovibrio sp. HK-II]